MNLYDLHSNPEQLHGYSTKEYRVPELAYKLAFWKPELRPKLEPAIMKDPRWAYDYATLVLQRRWAKAEPVIMKDAYYAYYYAKNIMGRAWPEAEPYIMKDPHYAFLYARNILERRWPDAELYIKTNNMAWSMYKRDFDL